MSRLSIVSSVHHNLTDGNGAWSKHIRYDMSDLSDNLPDIQTHELVSEWLQVLKPENECKCLVIANAGSFTRRSLLRQPVSDIKMSTIEVSCDGISFATIPPNSGLILHPSKNHAYAIRTVSDSAIVEVHKYA